MKVMDKTKEKKIAELIHKDIEKETRVEMKPVPPSQLDRMEKCLNHLHRMLKWVIVRKKLDYLSHDLEENEYRDEYRKPILDDMFKLGKQLPDISDIIKEP